MNNNPENKKQTIIYQDTINNIIVTESSGSTFTINCINYIVGEKKIKKMATKKVVPVLTE
jgi:hypothetical protein